MQVRVVDHLHVELVVQAADPGPVVEILAVVLTASEHVEVARDDLPNGVLVADPDELFPPRDFLVDQPDFGGELFGRRIADTYRRPVHERTRGSAQQPTNYNDTLQNIAVDSAFGRVGGSRAS